MNLFLELIGKMILWLYKVSMTSHTLVEFMYSPAFLIEIAANFIHSERN